MARLVAERSDVIPVLAEIFREHGYEGASLKLIGDKTGLGKGSLYHFFPGGKEEMATAVLEEIGAWFETNIYQPLEEQEPARALAGLFSGVSTYFRSGRRVCLVGAFALNDSRDRFPTLVKPYFDRWLATLANALERSGRERGEAERLSRTVVAGIQGAIVLARALDDETPFREMLEQLEARCRP